MATKKKKSPEVKIVEVPAVKSVPEKYKGVYQEYLDSPRPFDLRQQYAIINALYYELRDIVDSRVGARLQALDEEFKDSLTSALAGTEPSPEKILKATKISQIASNTMLYLLPQFVPVSTMLAQKDIESLSDLLERISRVAERMKKIQEGVELKVHIDMDMILKLTREVFLPILPTPQLKELALVRIRTFFLTRSGSLREALKDDEPVRSDPRDWGESVRAEWDAVSAERAPRIVESTAINEEPPPASTDEPDDSEDGWQPGGWDPELDDDNASGGL